MIRSRSRLRGGGGSSVPWYLSPSFYISGSPVNTFLDFKNNRYAVNSALSTFGNIFTVTRSHTGLNVATYHDASGYIQLATANTPRFDYDPATLLPKGILVEQLSSNTIRYTEDLSQAAWTKVGCTAALDAAAVNPYGTTGMYKITEDGATSEHGVNIAVNTGGTSPSWSSVFVKNLSGSRNVIVSAWNATSGHFYSAIFNPVTGAFVSGSGYTDYKAIQYPNGVWRFMVKGAAPSVKADFIYVRLASGTTASYAGDSTSAIYVWGAQRDSAPTSYIPNNTGVSTVNRQADVITNSASNTVTLASWINQTEGTFSVAYEPFTIGQTANRYALDIDDATANETMTMYFADNASDSLSSTIIDGGVSQFQSDVFAYVADSPQYQSLSYKLNNCSTAANENLGSVDASATMPTTTILRVGSSNSGEYLNGWVRAIAYTSARASDAETLRIASGEYFAE